MGFFMRPHGRARISRTHPQAQAVCDRCGFRFSHSDLVWQFEWIGPKLQNLRLLVHSGCLDTPQEQLRTIVLPPDPVPIANPRPEWFVPDDNPISGIGWEPANLFSLKGPLATSAISGTLTGGGGPDAAFFGGPQKMFVQSATFQPSSTAAAGNQIQINWSQIPGNPQTPAGLTAPSQNGYVVSSALVIAPVDTAFLGANISTTLELDGSSDGVHWTPLATAVTSGSRGESVALNSSIQTSYGYHRILVAGDGSHAVAIAKIELTAASASMAQTGSELGA